MPKRISADELTKQIEVLHNRLRDATVHFDLFMGIKNNWAKYHRDVSSAPLFWQFTLKAHSDAAILHLCRIYDTDSSSIQMSRLLANIENNQHLFNETAFRERHKENSHVEKLSKYRRTIDQAQLQQDIEYCSTQNSSIQTLRQWRNNVIAHANYRESVSPAKPFHEKHPLPFKSVESLINEGCNILNRYSVLLNATTYSQRFDPRVAGDFLYVLECQRCARVLRDRKRRNLYRKHIAIDKLHQP